MRAELLPFVKFPDFFINHMGAIVFCIIPKVNMSIIRCKALFKVSIMGTRKNFRVFICCLVKQFSLDFIHFTSSDTVLYHFYFTQNAHKPVSVIGIKQ